MYGQFYEDLSDSGQFKRRKVTLNEMEVADQYNPRGTYTNFGNSNFGVSSYASTHEHHSCPNDMFKFAVVRFVDEGGQLEIVSTNWIDYQQNVSWFPNVNSDQIRKDLLKARVVPRGDWMTAEINILKRFVDYSLAKCYLRDLQESWLDHTLGRRRTRRSLNNVDRDSSPEGSEPTKIKSSLWYPSPVYLTFEDKSLSPTEGCRPTQPASNACKAKTILGTKEINNTPSTGNNTTSAMSNKNKSSQPTPNFDTPFVFRNSREESSKDNTLESREINNTSHLTGNNTTSAMSTENNSSQPTPNFDSPFLVRTSTKDSVPTLSEQIKRLETNQSLMWDIINGLKNKVNGIDNNYDPMSPLVMGKKEASRSVSNEFMELFCLLPVSEENLPRFEELLATNTAFKETLVSMLVNIGGKSIHSVAAKVLQKLISDEAAELYSLTGKSRLEKEKLPFEKTRTFQLVRDLCFRMFKPGYIDNAEAKLRMAVSAWLQQAKIRRDRREYKTFKENIFEED